MHALFFTLVAAGIASYQADDATPAVEQWGVFEHAMHGPKDGNPFVDVTLSATFKHGDKHMSASGFYDGAGVYRIRFMPDAAGR